MSASKVKRDQTAERRARVAELHLKGWPNYRIVEELGLPRGAGDNTVSNDLSVIREEWKKARILDFHELKMQKLAELEVLKKELYEAWDRSKKDAADTTIQARKVRSQVFPPPDHGEGESKPELVDDSQTTTVSKATRDGNPVFTSQILAVIAKECDLLGIGADSKSGDAAQSPTIFKIVRPPEKQQEVG